jgi:hypothetical protein
LVTNKEDKVGEKEENFVVFENPKHCARVLGLFE